MSEEYVKIGHIIKPHGLKGLLKVKVQIERLREKNPGVFFIERNPSPLPYFVKSLEFLSDDYFIVSFEDIDSKTEAEKFTGSEIFVPGSAVKADDKRGDFTGFTIMDKQLGEIGSIEDILIMPMQQLAQLTYKGKEVLVPLNEAFIIRVEKSKKTIYVDLPEGLLDL